MRTVLVVFVTLVVCLTPAWGELDVDFVQKLIPDDGTPAGYLGYSQAVDGDIAVIGNMNHNANGRDSGIAYVFTREDGGWRQEARLLAYDGEIADNFGISIAVDRDTAIIGAWADDDNGENSGSAYVFTRNDGIWTLQGKLLSEDGTPANGFGYSVALSGDVALIGAPWNDDFGHGSGSAYVFRREEGVWRQERKLLADNGAPRHLFGYSVSIDQDTALVGVRLDDQNGQCSGSAYVFARKNGTRIREANLLADDGAYFDVFGEDVALDGDTALIGAPGAGRFGSAYVFRRQTGSWALETKLAYPDTTPNAGFSSSVSLSGDIALIGAPSDGTQAENAGAAYVFKRDVGSWGLVAKLVAEDGQVGSRFGFKSAKTDSETLLIGSNHMPPDLEGAVHTFEIGCSLTVTLDITPDSLDNPINANSRGVTPVALLGSIDLNVTTIDPSTLRFGRADAELVHRNGHQQDINMDGHMDLMMHFRTQDIGIECGDTAATLTGEDYEGCEIEGMDKVTPVGSCRWNKSLDEEPVAPVLDGHARTKRRTAK